MIEATALADVPGLEDYWAARTRRAPTLAIPARQARVLLDMLGLGIEQTMQHLGQDQPDYETFLDWIVDTAGPPDPDKRARYEAWVAGAPPSKETVRRLRAIEAMDDVLDANDLARWNKDGVVVLRDAIGAEEARAAADVLWQAVEGDPADPESWYQPRASGLWVSQYQHPALDVARRSPRIHKAFAQLWGTADLWTTTDKMSFSPPVRPDFAFRGAPLHWDVSLARPIPFSTGGILYLTDTAADQGALQVVPGFHHRIDTWLDALGDADPRAIDLNAETVTVPAGAGDLVIWRNDLPHGASPNHGARPRLAQYVNMYAPDMVEHAVWR